MSWIHAAHTRLRLLFARRAAEARMDDEFRFHIDMETERLVRERGLDPTEARRQTLAAFGGVENHKEALRSDRGLAWLTGMSLDLKLGARMLAKSPGLTLVGVVGMAVAIAIGAVSFAIIYTFIGTTVPLDDGDRVVVIQNVDTRRNGDGAETHLHDLATWRESLRSVSEIGAYRLVDRNIISAGARPDPMRIAEMTASGFRIARVSPILGRYFHDDDERPGAAPVVVIGYDVWQNRFGGEPGIVGRTVQLGATTHTVVGVMPRDFAFPVNNRVWTPLRLNPSDFERGKAPPIEVFGRLAPGITTDQAQTQLVAIGKRLAAEYPKSHQQIRPRVLPYALSFFDSPELVWALHLVQLLITMILVVIGTNVATLVYARTASRMREIAVRTALGASRRRIVAQLFTEALVLSAIAAAVGLGGASVALRYIREYANRMAGEQTPYWMDFGFSPGLLLYVAGLAVIGAVIVGVLPALKATGRRVQVNLQQLGATGSGMRLGKTWTVLIVAQVAVAVALLPVVLYSLFVQQGPPATTGPEFATSEWVTATVHLDRDGISTLSDKDDAPFAARHAMLEGELVRRLRTEPGMTNVLLASAVPGSEPMIRVEVENGRAAAMPDTARAAESTGRPTRISRVDLEMFRAFQVPILAGRGFQTGDVSATATAVIVNRSFVQQILGGGEPLGRRIRPAATQPDGPVESLPSGPWYEIVGVVPDFPTPASASDVTPKLYRPIVPGATNPVTLAIRVKGAPPSSVTGRLREVAVAVDPMLRLEDIRPLDETLSVERMASRVIFVAVTLVSLSVVLLSAAGIYALMSFTIARRRREIGIRTALGAGPRRVITGVLSKAARQIAIGIIIGIALAGVLVQAMEGGMGDVRGVVVLGGVAALMATIGLLAAWGPARRALRIQPTEALKAE